MFIPLKIKIYIGVGLACLALFGSYSYYIYNKGKNEVEQKQAVKQLEQEIIVRKKYEKVDKQTPFNADKRESLDWLYTNCGR